MDTGCEPWEYVWIGERVLHVGYQCIWGGVGPGEADVGM